MKTYRNLYAKICSFENLLLASRRARLGKRRRTDVATFEVNLEPELLAIRAKLAAGQYVPGDYKSFYIYEPKKRLISAAPYADRVVHHAICNIIEPLFERKFIYDSYANRRGKGTHRAILRFQEFARKSRYVLSCDIKQFFPSIDHTILKHCIRETIACPDTLALIDLIIDRSNTQDPVHEYFNGDDLFTPLTRRRGLPIGNLTSQFFANVYLNAFDHFMKEQLRCHQYLRYVDDFAVFGGEKRALHVISDRIAYYLESLRLRLHERKSLVHPVISGVTFLGQRISPDFRLLKKRNVLLFRRRLRRLQTGYASGQLDLSALRASIQSWIGHAKWADTYHLRERLLSDITFSKG